MEMTLTIENDPTITEAIGGPWPHDPRIVGWMARSDTGFATVRYQQRERGGVLEVDGQTLVIADARGVPTSVSDPTVLVEAIDVASWQPRDLTAIINSLDPRPTHVVVHLYMGPGFEAPSQDISREQIYSAQANGCTPGGYMFCYPGLDPRESVRRALGCAQSAGGFVPPVLWLDVEDYAGDIVGTNFIAFAAEESIRLGVPPGIYTNQSSWQRIGNPTQFSNLPLWAAHWTGEHTLETPMFGGWTEASARQYQGDPLDRSVFLYSVTV